MRQINVLIVTGYGTNSHSETAYAAQLAGAHAVDIVHFSEIVASKKKLLQYQFLIFPGGFLDGDDLGAAHAAAQRWKHLSDSGGASLLESLQEFIDNGGLVLGICNGFQLLVKLGVLPAFDGKFFEQEVTLSHNSSGRFENRWVHLKLNSQSHCVFTKNIQGGIVTMPVRHGEGKLVVSNPSVLQRLQDENYIALQYVDPITCEATQKYPNNPNGSPCAIAGLTDTTGRVLGLMPHPEAFHHPTNYPGWTRGIHPTSGTFIFRNGIEYLCQN